MMYQQRQVLGLSLCHHFRWCGLGHYCMRHDMTPPPKRPRTLTPPPLPRIVCIVPVRATPVGCSLPE
mgnify:CR=1 FL=1